MVAVSSAFFVGLPIFVPVSQDIVSRTEYPGDSLDYPGDSLVYPAGYCSLGQSIWYQSILSVLI